MWNDNDTITDFIDFQHFVNAIEKILANNELQPCTIGIYGDWGSGKSSLMRMVESSLAKDEKTLVIKFNGWLFEGYEDAKSVLMGSIIEEIAKKRTLTEKALKLGAKLLKKVDWIKASSGLIKHGLAFAAAGPAGLAITSGADLINKVSEVNYEELLKNINSEESKESTLRMSIREFHEDFEKLLKETKVERLVVFIDDLDRCNPDTIIGTLEAIKLFLFVENSAFVISADERLIKYAVRRRFPEIPGEGIEVGRDYLEKLIQFPIRIPQLSITEIETYINLLFTKLSIEETAFEEVRGKILKSKGVLGESCYNFDNAEEYLGKDIPEDLVDALTISRQITQVLAIGLNGNPRQCKRFLNMLLMRADMANFKVISIQRKILAKLMLLEYFKSETFRALYEMQAASDGKPKELIQIEESVENSSDAKKEKSTEKLGAEYEAWLADDWFKKWVIAEPKLRDVDLRPYFYLSRDQLGTTSVAAQRMTPKAQEVFRKLSSDSEAFRKNGLTDAKDLSQAEASSIFEAISEKVRTSEDLSGDKSILNVLFEFCDERKELLSQMITLLSKLPEAIIPISTPIKLKNLIKGTDFETSGDKVIQEWTKSTKNTKLAKSASNANKRKT